MDYIRLFNELVKVIKPTTADSCLANSLTDDMQGLGLDSLDFIMLFLYLSDIYGIDDETARTMPTGTIEELFQFIRQRKTIEPASIEAAVDAVK